MALPNILRRLFKGGGYGPELNDGIVSKTISNQDWSNSYDYPVGVVVRGSDGALYYSVEQSGPGTSAGAKDPAQGGNPDFWKKFGSVDSIPTGTVLWLSTPTVPIGYLLCNGSAVGRATYPELFAAIGTTYGSGDGSTTFNLPNLIDKFAQGSAVAGTVKAAGLPNITGSISPLVWTSGSASGAFSLKNQGKNLRDPGGGYNFGEDVFTLDASRSSSIYGNSNTVQPPALTLLPCIKAFSSVVGDATVIAGQLVNEIQSKVALDGSNASAIGKTLSTYMAHATSLAVESKVSITLPYVAPADGWLLIHGRANYQGIDTRVHLSYSGVDFCAYKIFWDGSSNSVDSAALIPMSKGVRAYLASGGLINSEFYYANGTKP